MQEPVRFSREIPQTIGPFRLVRLLGAGATGAVYLGERMEQFSQQVAIKILHRHLFPQIADARMNRERQILAALGHPGIVRLLDLSAAANGQPCIVMEYVDGVPLDVYCDQRRLSICSRIEILLAVFEAVEHAHRHFVVHADLKPENILVTAEGKPRLLDFGVATILSDLDAVVPNSPTLDQPEASENYYTALYASPEQRYGERRTVACDIYSLGLIVQTVITGVRPTPLPIDALRSKSPDSVAAVTARKLRTLDHDLLKEIAVLRATTPSGLAVTIQGDLEAILTKALRLNPRERFESVQELRDEFARYLSGYPIQTRPAGWATRTRKWARRNRLAASLGLVFVLALLFSIAGVVSQAAEAARKRQIAETRLHDLVRLTDILAGDLYESVRGLQGSESAQVALLNSAHQTVNKLAAEEDGDAQLELELARVYEKLARLEFGRTPLTAEAVRQGSEDLKKESGLLERLRESDPEAARVRERLPELLQLRNAGERQLGLEL